MKKATLTVSLEYVPGVAEPTLAYEMKLDEKVTRGVIPLSPQDYAEASSVMMHLVYILLASLSQQPNDPEPKPESDGEPNGPSVS